MDKDQTSRDGTPRTKREELALLVSDPDDYVEMFAERYRAGRRG